MNEIENNYPTNIVEFISPKNQKYELKFKITQYCRRVSAMKICDKINAPPPIPRNKPSIPV